MAGFKSKKGLELAIDEGNSSSGGFKPSQNRVITANAFAAEQDLNNSGDDVEMKQPPSNKKRVLIAPKAPSSSGFGGFSLTKGDDPNNFANENVMAKSNLRERK